LLRQSCSIILSNLAKLFCLLSQISGMFPRHDNGTIAVSANGANISVLRVVP
jgi:hypothetical protein